MLNKYLGIGVLIGVFLTTGVYVAIQKYTENRMQQKFAVFQEGYKNAKDKDTFFESYDFGENGITVSISTSNAAESGGEPDIDADSSIGFGTPQLPQSCLDIISAYDRLERQMYALATSAPSIDEFIQQGEIFNNMRKDLNKQWKSSGCLKITGKPLSNWAPAWTGE